MKLLCGIGVNDANYTVTPTVNGKQVWCKFYRVWVCMIKRCYCEATKKGNPTYDQASVCEDWLTFSKFKTWMESQDWEGKELDKDLLVRGNKVYSPETCLFVSKQVNMFITALRRSNGELPIGVSLHKPSGKFQAYIKNLGKGSKRLGVFETAEAAHKAWRAEKNKLATELSKAQTDPRVAKAIIEYYKEQ